MHDIGNRDFAAQESEAVCVIVMDHEDHANRLSVRRQVETQLAAIGGAQLMLENDATEIPAGTSRSVHHQPHVGARSDSRDASAKDRTAIDCRWIELPWREFRSGRCTSWPNDFVAAAYCCGNVIEQSNA
jgi:hypothetical protein